MPKNVYHFCPPHHLVTSKQSQARLTGQKTSNHLRKRGLKLVFAVLTVAGILYFLSFFELPFVTEFVANLPDPKWKATPVVLALVGTALGAVGAVGPKKTDPIERRRDRVALAGWSFLFVGALGAVIVAGMPAGC